LPAATRDHHRGASSEAERPHQATSCNSHGNRLPYAHADPASGFHEEDGGPAGGGTHPDPGEENKEVPATSFLRLLDLPVAHSDGGESMGSDKAK